MAERPGPDRSSIEGVQLTFLQALFEALRPANRFYSAKLVGLKKPSSLAEFSANVPFTAKQELVEDQRLHPPYGSNLTQSLEKYTRYCQTSASTGMPLRWLDTNDSWAWMLANWDRVFNAAGVTVHDRIFFAFSFGPFLGFWTAFEAGTRRGCLCIPGGGMSSVARLRVILDNDVTVLCCTPTYALRLAEAAREDASTLIDLTTSSVRRILVAGEPGGSIPSVRQRIEAAWPGARVVDHHGMTEVGPVSYECSARPGVLHIIEESYLAEVVDPVSGAQTEVNSTGELVLTTLGRTSSPLLRYRTGDLVRRSANTRCACGTCDMALEGGILGRADDMVVVRGVNVYPSAIEEIMRGFSEVSEFRVHVLDERSMTELRLEIEPVAGCSDNAGLARRVEERVRAVLALRVPVAAVEHGVLPRFEMKAKRWIRSTA